jgi:hypothetical protein
MFDPAAGGNWGLSVIDIHTVGYFSAALYFTITFIGKNILA